MGITVAVEVCLLLLGGLELDSIFHTSPLGLAAGLLLGILAAGCTMYVRFRQFL